jgi:SAM-dependent methyltransferase
VTSVKASSFRDPGGAVVAVPGRILRILNGSAVDDLRTFLAQSPAQKAVDAGELVRTWDIDNSGRDELLADPAFRSVYASLEGVHIVEHERIRFPSYPYEWAPEMLHAAAGLTLQLATRFRKAGFSLKDATPLNVLFRGPEPVHVDLLSFERRDPRDPTWLPYAQFVRTFLLPLLANKQLGLPLDQALTVRRDGLEPEELYRWLSPVQRCKPPYLTLVTIPMLLSRNRRAEDASIYERKLLNDPEKAQFMLESVFSGLRRALNRATPKAGLQSTWSGYVSNNSYSREQFEAKERFVNSVLTENRPKTVLDVGCNTGHFSAMAARAGASVVALDYDPVVVGSVWRAARQERLDILPLVLNLARPTPALGWNNAEFPSFLERARGASDLVLMLAVIHHLLVTERIPLDTILEMAASLTRRDAIIEFIHPSDAMFRKITRGRDALHESLTTEAFEATAAKFFDTVRKEPVQGSARVMYLLRKKCL